MNDQLARETNLYQDNEIKNQSKIEHLSRSLEGIELEYNKLLNAHQECMAIRDQLQTNILLAHQENERILKSQNTFNNINNSNTEDLEIAKEEIKRYIVFIY